MPLNPTSWGLGSRGGYLGYIRLEDQKAVNTEGGGYTTGSYVTRTLNTEVSDTNGDCALAANQFTLTAGTYDCLIRVPCFFTGRSKARLRNQTANTTILVGGGEITSGGTNGATCMVLGQFTVAAAQALAVEFAGDTTRATNGLGAASNLTEIEVYTQVELWRVS